MIETEYTLDENAIATLDASGNATVFKGPQYAGERWHVNLFSARGSDVASLAIFRGNGMSRLDGTERADDDTSNTDIDVAAQESLRFVWTEGAAGAVMQCTIQGKRYVRGRRAYGV